MKTVDTYWANIYCGLQKAYSGEIIDIAYAKELCQKFCNEVKLGLTFTPTNFIYVDGSEPGFIVGLINYPRFPSSSMIIIQRAKELGLILLKELSQERLSIVTRDRTIMLEKEDLDHPDRIV